ncbi:2-deoxy-D-gluconate 3-dehydrogenase [Spongiactinospora rosea]|uniref:2-deoxy-D-gluconate 3-dehydrogenase n=1 Tax=Spongiactinospora rosea TaxID=2248750 RepID=A0A366LRM7_9ACTN|nr:2-deoxy-D-gluconate 3-dehydrogenase [Spongiactinospora rosea]
MIGDRPAGRRVESCPSPAAIGGRTVVGGQSGRDPSGAGQAAGRTVVVVGGTSGIGTAIAERFAASGAEVIAAGLRAEHSPAAAVARTVELDLTSGDDLERFLSGLSRLDVLVNAAGVLRRGAEYDPEVFARVIEINLNGAMRACVAARGLLARSGGCIVNVASMLSFLGGPLVPAYTASKGGVLQLTKALAVAWAAEGIRVNAVAPGWIRTALTADLHQNPETERRIVERTPMRRWGEPSDVAGAVAFLCGPDARFITGVVLPVDGGYLAA